MNRVVLITLALMLGCEDPPQAPNLTTVLECREEHKEKLAPWILECIANANPKSDEEPEDWIGRCEGMGRRTLCDQIPALRYQTCGSCSWRTVPCKDVTNPDLKSVCPSEP